MSRVYFRLSDVSHCTPEPRFANTLSPAVVCGSDPILDYTHTHTRTFWNNCFTLAVLLKYSKHVLRNNFRRNTFIWMHHGSQWCWAASLRCGAGLKPCRSSAVCSFRPIMCLCVCFLKVVYFILNLNPWNVSLRTPLLHILVFGQQLTSIIKCSLKIVNCALTHSFFWAAFVKLMFRAGDKQAVLVATLYFVAALFPLLPLLLFLAPFTLRQLLSEISDLLWSAVLSQPNIFFPTGFSSLSVFFFFKVVFVRSSLHLQPSSLQLPAPALSPLHSPSFFALSSLSQLTCCPPCIRRGVSCASNVNGVWYIWRRRAFVVVACLSYQSARRRDKVASIRGAISHRKRKECAL